ncbi:hypothetical protein [Streptomyces sp. NPDC001978]|uniref:hypothetical protein n=1 Tax=Streptomyces sp. NPDC001978 TaxID=3364627 RepID=UPI0036751791
MIIDVELHRPGLGKPIQSGAHQYRLDTQSPGGGAKRKLNSMNGTDLTPIGRKIHN